MMKNRLYFVEQHAIDHRQNHLPAGSQLPWFLPLLNRSCKAPR
ncbi:hypothetical protein YPPY47_4166 [Yersinia pestis PY-47]|nr:hypothetical protein YPPY02_4066 [Yersinia pestis PY-02]EIQ99106.1 hypothetical protein YPPY05_4052 [Yersinia pestis PY-05]EIR02561.1 hypothetical protein YPPY06_4110 [Yersinia pestis PY-06]EIR13469.1 hypothetical protein YPPY07_3976 [Yersinia pestis PY-07]EIR43455.1 hypothetical protein YPPY14_3999 [Yersinia pestis PY-14]EIR60925.1 hypothetical protein YPPY25_4105 [Yersinia pestis PY-25]EIR70683.1 hypothetical protein YPPY29_3914 [Yersinia pestis PY-29]EIR71878.1 hypothetical protein YPP